MQDLTKRGASSAGGAASRPSAIESRRRRVLRTRRARAMVDRNEDLTDVAAALVVALESGLLDTTEVVRAVDREIERSPSPPSWLINVSLATRPEDVLHCLREAAVGHQMLTEVWVALDAMERALRRGRNVMDVAPRISAIYPYGDWPPELSDLLYDVDEELYCAHGHGGIAQPAQVEAALRALLAAGSGKSAWSSVLDRVVG